MLSKIPTRLSSALGTTSRALRKQGAYDGFVDVDSLLYVDPHLLSGTRVPELSHAAAKFAQHFRSVVKLVKASKSEGDAFWREARSRLTFSEVPQTSLGYTRGGTSGRAIGFQLANGLTKLAKEIVTAGIEDPELFELIGLLQEGIGADLISDMTVNILFPDLAEFSRRVARKLGIPTAISSEGTSVLPVTGAGRSVLLVPADLLRSLPVANSWEDIDRVARHNESLRRQVNSVIGDTWRRATGRRVSKREFRETLLRHPELIRDLIDQYRRKKSEPYDFERDVAGVELWYESAREVANERPLDLSRFGSAGDNDPQELAMLICLRFKHLVEENRLGRILFNDDGTPRKEKTAQLFFFTLAVSYCDANNLDISPEADAGAGPVDFKFSRGSASKTTVEIKLSSNPHLVHGLLAQLPAYSRAENARCQILLVIQNGDHKKKLQDLRDRRKNASLAGLRVPELLFVDGRPVPPASKRLHSL